MTSSVKILKAKHAWFFGNGVTVAWDRGRNLHCWPWRSTRRTWFLYRSAAGSTEWLVPSCCRCVVVLPRHIVGVEEFLEPLHKLKVVLESTLHELLHWNNLRHKAISSGVIRTGLVYFLARCCKR